MALPSQEPDSSWSVSGWDYIYENSMYSHDYGGHAPAADPGLEISTSSPMLAFVNHVIDFGSSCAS